MKDEIVDEVRSIRRDSEKKHGRTWEELERYLPGKQKKAKRKLYTGTFQRFIKSKVA
jgi:hypothetical protein